MMRAIPPSDAQRALMTDLKAAIGKNTGLSAMEMLAVASQLVGNLIALQDQFTYTPQQAMAIVAGNIEVGNRAAMAEVLGPAAGNA